MNIDEVLQLLEVKQKKALTRLQELVLRSCWEGKTYVSMAAQAHYGAQSIREVAVVSYS